MEESLQQRVVGQDHVVEAISDAVRISRAGLQAPNRPTASFLFLGPTGVGKVCSLTIAIKLPLTRSRPSCVRRWPASCLTMSSVACTSKLLVNLSSCSSLDRITINMSEYHDRHTISRLIGAAPGYVGFEEGGQLTEAVRRRPYGMSFAFAWEVI